MYLLGDCQLIYQRTSRSTLDWDVTRESETLRFFRLLPLRGWQVCVSPASTGFFLGKEASANREHTVKKHCAACKKKQATQTLTCSLFFHHTPFSYIDTCRSKSIESIMTSNLVVNFYRFLLISIEFDRQLLIFMQMDTGNALVWKKINGRSPSSDLKYSTSKNFVISGALFRLRIKTKQTIVMWSLR